MYKEQPSLAQLPMPRRIDEKNIAEGTDAYVAISKSCGDVLRDDRQTYCWTSEGKNDGSERQ